MIDGSVHSALARAFENEVSMSATTARPAAVLPHDAIAMWFDTVQADRKSHLVWLGIFAGLMLTAIGIRFLLAPYDAAHTFGVSRDVAGAELHHIIAMRDLWLGLLAVAFAGLREWRSLGLWFVMGAVVCVADAGIVASTTAKWWALTFHLSSALFCGWVGFACLKYTQRTR